MSTRRTLLELFDAALRAVDGRVRVSQFLRARSFAQPVAVVAVGKAASAMTLGAFDALGERVESALVITKDGHVDPGIAGESRCTVFESAHPVPDTRSLAAGAALDTCVGSMRPGVLPLFLVSGGSSSLVESLRPGVSLADLRSLNVRGLAAGLAIGELNRERARLSSLKAGGVARRLAGRRALALFLSDVPGDDPQVIGSGLLGHDGVDDAIERVVVASVATAVAAVDAAARARGLELDARSASFAGEAAAVAADFVAALRACPADGIVWGGESTVALPATPGRGGRNMHLALAAARLLREGETLTILAAGTDGTDGPTEDAGAIVDAGSIGRAEIAGCDVERAYREFDSGTALEASGDLVHTGPTGTNVGDLLIGLRRSATSVRDAARGHML
jgi:hydroxypyruvate reductase